MVEGMQRQGASAEPTSVLEHSLLTRNRMLEASYALGQAVSKELKMDPLCDLILLHLQRVFSVDGIALLFLDEHTGEMYVKRSVGRVPRELLAGVSPRDTGIAAAAFREQRLVVWDPRSTRSKQPQKLPSGLGPNALVAVPLRREESELGAQEPLPPTSARDDAMGSAAVPLMAECKVKGVLVLAWGRSGEDPGEEDLLMLRVLAGQVAAAIDNAWLYGEIASINAGLERTVAQRTAELNAKNEQLACALEGLKQTQLQLIQNEKMASLGQLTAGIAHEINNPLAFSISNIASVLDRLAQLRLRAKLLATWADVMQAANPDQRLQPAMAFVRSLAHHPRYADDVKAFTADVRDLGPSEGMDLAIEFLHYVRLREEQHDGPLGPLIDCVANLLVMSQEGLDRVKGIVLNLRTFSRLDEAQFQNADIDSGIASTLAIVEHAARDRQVTLRRVAQLDRSYACFPAQLNQVVLNLVTNALHAVEPGGQVTVTTLETPQGPTIEVADNGCGIPEENLPKIFDPFFTTKPVGQGTGLGLSISYRIVEEHKGTIQVHSKVGEGTRFVIQLPPRSNA
jgi:signal transduction histidine kinase